MGIGESHLGQRIIYLRLSTIFYGDQNNIVTLVQLLSTKNVRIMNILIISNVKAICKY